MHLMKIWNTGGAYSQKALNPWEAFIRFSQLVARYWIVYEMAFA